MARLPRAWKNRTYKQLKRRGEGTAALVPAAAPLPLAPAAVALAVPQPEPVVRLVTAASMDDSRELAEVVPIGAKSSAAYPWGGAS